VQESSDLCAAYGLDSLSQDSGEDGKADDMNEMDMPNPGSIQVESELTSIHILSRFGIRL
jgi:hypothetical protein